MRVLWIWNLGAEIGKGPISMSAALSQKAVETERSLGKLETRAPMPICGERRVKASPCKTQSGHRIGADPVVLVDIDLGHGA